jgi:hypothetical protein
VATGIASSNEITGVYETLAALKAFDVNLARRTDKKINDAAREVANLGQSLVDPQGLSGFQRQLPGGRVGARRAGYDPAEISKGIKVKRRRQKKASNGEVRSFVVIANTTAAGAIWEVAGRTSDGVTPAGIAMVRNIRNRGGAASRTVWAAADQTDMGAVRDKITAAINESVAEANTKIKRI